MALDVKCYSQMADTPERIAIRFNVDVQQIIANNPGLVPNQVIPLHTIVVLASSDVPVKPKKKRKSPIEKVKSIRKKVDKCK